MRTLVFIVSVILTSANASGSEAMPYAGVYECNAVLINKDMSDICAAQNPALALRSKAAYEKWMSRNSTKAEAKKTVCEAQLHQLEREERRIDEGEPGRLIQQLSRQILDNFKERVAAEGSRACDEALFQLEAGAGGVDFK